jgi:hypothetical protein
LVSQLLHGFFVIGDNAYTLPSTLLIPYSGVNKQNRAKDTFNFFLLQLCVRVQQAFDKVVYFKKPLEVKFWHTTLTIEAPYRLHNYCINKNEYAADNKYCSSGVIHTKLCGTFRLKEVERDGIVYAKHWWIKLDLTVKCNRDTE